MSQHVETVAFRNPIRERKARAVRHQERLRERHPATVAKRLALAHRLDDEIEAGEYVDYADVARRHGLTRARLTQLMSLLLLAPDIQEEVLELEFTVGRQPIAERNLRWVVETLDWDQQRERWGEVKKNVRPRRGFRCG